MWWEGLLLLAIGFAAGGGALAIEARRNTVPREDYDDALDEIRRLHSLRMAERDAKVKVYRQPYDWDAVRRRGGRR